MVWGPVVWIPGIPLWKGLLLGCTPRIPNHRAPNQQVTISWRSSHEKNRITGGWVTWKWNMVLHSSIELKSGWKDGASDAVEITWTITPYKKKMNTKNGGWKMGVLFNWVIFRFNILIFIDPMKINDPCINNKLGSCLNSWKTSGYIVKLKTGSLHKH